MRDKPTHVTALHLGAAARRPYLCRMRIDPPEPANGAHVWAAVLLMTLAAIVVVIGLWLALLSLAPAPAAGLIALGVGVVLAIAIGRVSRWLTRN